MLSPPRSLRDEQIEAAIFADMKRCIEADNEYGLSKSFREQCFHACRILHEQHVPPVPFSVIAKAFSITKGSLKSHLKAFSHHLNNCLPAGRHAVLTAEQLTSTVEFILQRFKAKRPPKIGEVRAFIDDNFQIDVSCNTLHHILRRDPRVRAVHARPMEDKRLHVTPEQIQAHFTAMFEQISGVPAHFIFNMDEMGHQDWADAHETVCFVPSDIPDEIFYYPVSRAGKRITLIAAIAADGSYLRPAIIIPRETFDDELLLTGLTPEKVEIYSQAKSFITGDIFDDWIKDTFVPELLQRRARYSYHGPAFLILDNCTSHAGEYFDWACSEYNFLPFFIPPHSSNQLQMLDLCLFGITKRLISRLNKAEKINIQSDHIIKIMNSFLSAAVPKTITASFRNAGLELIMDPDRVIRMRVAPEKARCIIDKAVSDLLNPTIQTEYEEEEEDIDTEIYKEACAQFVFGA
jgi:hypothetical protein